MEWFHRFSLSMTAGDALLSLALNILAAFLAFLLGLNFEFLKSLIGERRLFRKLFGPRTIRDGFLTITLDIYQDTRRLEPDVQRQLGINNPWSPEDGRKRFFKPFAGGVKLFSGAWEELLGYCSARGAMYLADAFGKFLPKGARVTSDVAVAEKWEGTFINIGSSTSNIKTDQIRNLPENKWLRDSNEGFVLPTGGILQISDKGDIGVILRMANPRSKGSTLFVCAGMGEWGSSGAAHYLARNWKSIASRFGRRDFALFVIVGVDPPSDENVCEVCTFSDTGRLEQILASAKNIMRGFLKRP